MSYYYPQLGLKITSVPVSVAKRKKTQKEPAQVLADWEKAMREWVPASDIAPFLESLLAWHNVGATIELSNALDAAIDSVAASRDANQSDIDKWREFLKLEFALALPELLPMPSFWPLVYQEWVDLKQKLETVTAPGPMIVALTENVISADTLPINVEPETVLSDEAGTILPTEGILDTIKGLSTTQIILLAVAVGVSINVIRDMFKPAPSPRLKTRKNPCYGRR